MVSFLSPGERPALVAKGRSKGWGDLGEKFLSPWGLSVTPQRFQHAPKASPAAGREGVMPQGCLLQEELQLGPGSLPALLKAPLEVGLAQTRRTLGHTPAAPGLGWCLWCPCTSQSCGSQSPARTEPRHPYPEGSLLAESSSPARLVELYSSASRAPGPCTQIWWLIPPVAGGTPLIPL